MSEITAAALLDETRLYANSAGCMRNCRSSCLFKTVVLALKFRFIDRFVSHECVHRNLCYTYRFRLYLLEGYLTTSNSICREFHRIFKIIFYSRPAATRNFVSVSEAVTYTSRNTFKKNKLRIIKCDGTVMEFG